MARSYTFSLLAFSLSITLMASVIHAQANRPLNVSSDDAANSKQNQTISKDEMIRRAKVLAQQAQDAQHRATTPVTTKQPAAFPQATAASPANVSPAKTFPAATSERAPLGPTATSFPSNTQAQAGASNDSGASDTGVAAAPPVVPLDPNENKPLGPSGAGQLDNNLQASGSNWGITKTILALAFVVGLMLAGRQLMLRWMGRPATVNKSRAVEVLSRVSVGPKQHVVLLRMGNRILVVADSAGQMRPLANIDEPEEVASILKNVTTSRPSSISQGFGQMLGRFDQEYDEQDDSVRISEEGQDTAEFQVDKTRDQINGLLARVKAMAGKGGA